MYCITERWLLYFSLGLINFSATITGIGDGKALQAFSFILLPDQDYFCVRVLSMMCQRWPVAFTGVPACVEALLCFDNWIWASNRTFGIHLFIIMSVQKSDGGGLQSQWIHRSAGGQIVLLLFILSKYLVVTNQSPVFLLTTMCSHLGHTIVNCGLRSYIWASSTGVSGDV